MKLPINLKMRYNIMITFVMFMISSSIHCVYLHAHGSSFHSSQSDNRSHNCNYEPPGNPSYKTWCESTFTNGSFVYEAYRQIAFNINYAQEPPHNDFWQTPFETLYRRAGDCEDAVLLFNHILPQRCNNGRIIWGVIADLKKNIEFAHVWFELRDKKGQLYLVEPFTKDWNGIVPIALMQNKKIKKEIMGIPDKLISDLFTNTVGFKAIKRSILKKEVRFDPDQNGLIDDIFAKLRRVAMRYEDQKNIIKKQNNGK